MTASSEENKELPNEEFSHSSIICPYCEYDDGDIGEYGEGCTEETCGMCHKEFDLEVSVSFSYETKTKEKK